MIITSATPKELINWFHTRQEEQKVLCVMLAPSMDDQRKMATLVRELHAADAVLGEEVALLLLHPSANTPLGLDKGYGKFSTLCGTAFPSQASRRGLAYSLRDAEIFRDMSKMGGIYCQEIAEKSTQAMALFTPEFMKLLSVSHKELPALCVLIKSLNESIVLPLGKDWSLQFLLELIGKIRSATDELPNFQTEFRSLADAASSKIIMATEATREIDAKIAQISKILEQIVWRHQGNEDDHTLVVDFVAQGCRSTEQLQAVLRRLSFRNNVRYIKDGQVQKVIRLMDRVEEVRIGMSAADLRARHYVLTVGERAQKLVERRQNLFKTIHDLRGARLERTSDIASPSFSRIYSGLEGINLAGDLGEKLGTAVGWVRKLIGI